MWYGTPMEEEEEKEEEKEEEYIQPERITDLILSVM